MEKKYCTVESERNDLRRELQHVQDENELMKTYMNRLPSDIEYQKLQQSFQILEDQFKQSKQTLAEHRQEKNQLKKLLTTYQQTIDDQERKLQTMPVASDPSMFNAKCLTIDERVENEKQLEHLKKIIRELNETLHQEQQTRKEQQYLQETNQRTVQSLSNEIDKKEQTIKEISGLLRQVGDLWVRFPEWSRSVLDSSRARRSSCAFDC